MADGAVRFISENIDAGNQSLSLNATLPAGMQNRYGIWGSLGSKSGAEVLGEF